jgi:hypothetical protein
LAWVFRGQTSLALDLAESLLGSSRLIELNQPRAVVFNSL